jgi:WD40 repeat protein
LPFQFSPDGSRLAVAGFQGVMVYNARTRQEERMLGPGIPVAFPNGERVLIYRDKRLGAWDVTTGQSAFFTPADLLPLDVSGNGRAAVLRQKHPQRDQDVLTVWDLTTGQQKPALPEVGGKVIWARLSPDGRRLAYHDLSRPAAIRVWDVSAEKNLPDLTGLMRGSLQFFDPSGSTFFSPDGSLVAAMAGKNVVTVWDVETGHRVATLKDNELPNLRFFGTQGQFGWEALQDNRLPVWSRDGRWLATIGREESHNNSVVKLWEITPGPASYQLALPVDSLSLSADGQRLAANNTIWEVERQPGRTLLKPSPLQTEGRFAVFTRQGGLWAVDARQAPHQMWSSRGRLAKPGEPVRIRQLAPETKELTVPNPHRVNCLGLSPDGRLLLLCCEDAQAKKSPIVVWDLIEDRQLAVWEPHTFAPHNNTDIPFSRYFVRFSADGKRVVTCTDAGAEVWDVSTGERLQLLRFVEQDSNSSTFYGGAFPAVLSPDGKRAFVGLSGGAKINQVRGVVGVADAETGSLIGIWKEHQGAVWSLAISPDGKMLASGGAARMPGLTSGDDLTIHLWEVPTGRELARWQAHEGGVTALAFSPDSETLFSGSGDGSLKVWNLSDLRKELASLGLG